MASLAKANKARREQKLRDPLTVAKLKPTSMRAAINAKCYDCEGRNYDPAWQWRVGNCTIPECPLYNLRPYQEKEGTPTPTTLIDTPYATDVKSYRENA